MISVVLGAQVRAEARRGRRRLLKFNEEGRRIGETHHKAVLTDHEVDLMLQLREEGYGYDWLAEKFEISRWTAQSICLRRRRNQHAVRVTKESE